MTTWEKSVLGRGKDMCVGAVMGKGLVYCRNRRNSKKASRALGWMCNSETMEFYQKCGQSRRQLIRDIFG